MPHEPDLAQELRNTLQEELRTLGEELCAGMRSEAAGLRESFTQETGQLSTELKTGVASLKADIALLMQEMGKVQPCGPPDFSPVVDAVREFQCRSLMIDNKLDAVSSVLQDMLQLQQRLNVRCGLQMEPARTDLSPLLEQVKQMCNECSLRCSPQPEPDRAAVPELIQEVRKICTECSALLDSVRDSKIQLDHSRADLLPLIQEIWQKLPKVGTAVPNMDLSPIINEIQHLRPSATVDISAILQAINELKASVHHSRAIVQLPHADVDLSPVINAIRQMEDRVRAVVNNVDHSAIVSEVRQVPLKIYQALDVVTEARKESRTVVDASNAGFSHMLVEVQKLQGKVSEVLQATTESIALWQREGRARATADHVDLSLVLAEVRKLQDGCSEVFGATAETKALWLKERQARALDLSPVLDEVHRLQGQVSEVLQVATETRSLRQAEKLAGADASVILEVRKLQGQVSEVLAATAEFKGLRPDLSPVISEVRRHSVDFFEVLTAIREGKTVVDMTPMVDQVKQLSQQVVEAMRINRNLKPDLSVVVGELRQHSMDFFEVLKAIRESKTTVDLAPISKEISRLSQQVDQLPLLNEFRQNHSKVLAELSSVHSAVSTLAIERREAAAVRPDLSPVLQAIRDSRVEVDLAPVIKAIQDGKVDLAPVSKAIHDSKADFVEILKTVQGNRANLSSILSAVENLRAPLKQGLELGPEVINAFGSQWQLVKPKLDKEHQSLELQDVFLGGIRTAANTDAGITFAEGRH